MFPELEGVDHVHVYVSDRQKAAEWYERVLGFQVNTAYIEWAKDERGPLVMEDPKKTIHMALFAREKPEPHSSVAFKASGKSFLAWKARLETQGLTLRLADHKLSWSLYFNDLEDNMYEITTYEHDYVSGHLQEV